MRNLDKPTVDLVHLQLFRPSVIRDPWSRSNWDLSFWPQLSCSHVTRSYWRSHHSFYFSGVRADQHLDVEIVGCYPHQPHHNTVCTYMVRLMGIGGLGAGSLAKVESSKFQYCYSGAWYYSGSHYYHSSNAFTPTPLQGISHWSVQSKSALTSRRINTLLNYGS